MPFGNLADHELFQTLQGKKIKFTAVTPFSIKPYKNLINDLNNTIDDTDQVASFHYYDINELNNVTPNISPLPFHFDKLYALLSELDHSPDIIAISECCLKSSTKSIVKINLENYCVEHTPTESSNGGTLLHIKNDISYKVRNHLKIYKSKELELIFMEIINKTSKNTIVGCIYKHPTISISEFNNTYIKDLLVKANSENREIMLMGDFNTNLLNYESNESVADFLDTMYTHGFLSGPTRLTLHSKTLIDNIFYSGISNDIQSGNTLTNISDHLSQILFLPSKKNNNTNSDIYECNSKNTDVACFQDNIGWIDWNTCLDMELNNTNKSFDNFLTVVNDLLDTYDLYKKLSLRKIKLKKLWLTKDILTSIKVKNRLYRKFSLSKDESIKTDLHNKFKNYRHYLKKITRLSKTNHYRNFFEENKKNILKTWNGIKQLINIDKKSTQKINCIRNENLYIHDAKQMA